MPRRQLIIAIVISLGTACGGGSSAEPATSPESGTSGSESPASGSGERARDENEFQLNDSEDADQARGERPSEIEATRTQAAMRLFVVDPEAGPLQGVVIKLTGPDGATYFTGETDSLGYAEVLVPNGARYEMEYLSLGQRTQRASVTVADTPNLDMRLTLRHRRQRARAVSTPLPGPQEPAATPTPAEVPGFVLAGVLFESNSATIQPASYERLDRVVEYLTHMRSARIRVAGHTDNVGNPRRNQQLSEQRAQAVREYIVSHGIAGDRVEAVGYGDAQPVAPNDTERGRAQNRRIEAVEL
jgi:outer membrane protein OmpA-like peptidoglycan-associated protein